MALVTVDQVNAALRLDLVDDDERTPDIELKIGQAEDIVLDFIQPKPDPEWNAETVPARVTAAVIMTVACLLDDSEESAAMISGLSGMTGADPNNRIAALLWRLRKPSLA
jgi:hypothetical protein